MRDVLGVAREAVEQGPLRPILLGLATTEVEDATTRLPELVCDRFRDLTLLSLERSHRAGTYEHLREALEFLRELYQDIRRSLRSKGTVEAGLVWSWPVKVPVEYVQLIESQNPAALIILAHFATATTVVETWYTSGWADCCLIGIEKCLPDDLKQWLRWPWEIKDDRFSQLFSRDSQLVGPLQRGMIT